MKIFLACSVHISANSILNLLFIRSGDHGGILRTMHCRLCIDCYGTGYLVCVCWGMGVGGGAATLPPHTRFRNKQRKDDSALFSRFLHGGHPYSQLFLAPACPKQSSPPIGATVSLTDPLLVQVLCQVVVLGSGVAYSIPSYWCNCLIH